MNIKDVEKKTGLSKPNIRYYEEVGLIAPERGDNNYRVYSDSDVDRLNNIKKLRLIGLPIESIKSFFAKEEALTDILAKRLDEINSDTGILKKQAEVCRIAISNNAETVADISLDEKSETWQRRLAILLRDDIVLHKLSRSEFNRDVLLMYIAGCAIALLTTVAMAFFGGKFFMGSNYVMIVWMCAILFTGFVPLWSSNLTSHIAALCISEVVTAAAIWIVLQDSIYWNTLIDLGIESKPATRIVFVMYFGLIVLALVCWTLSQLSARLFKSAAVAFVLGLVYAGYVYGVSSMICNIQFAITTKLLIVFISFVLSLVLTMQWAEINQERKSFNRYSAMLTASKAINVGYALLSGYGYNRWTNMRR